MVAQSLDQILNHTNTALARMDVARELVNEFENDLRNEVAEHRRAVKELNKTIEDLQMTLQSLKKQREHKHMQLNNLQQREHRIRHMRELCE